jgi:hypothetical protein
MFNQKVNHFISENPFYVNKTYTPRRSAVDVHNFRKIENCGSLPLQTWSSKLSASAAFAMRPIVSSTEYFSNIKKYLQSVTLSDLDALKASNLASEKYSLFEDYGLEPAASLLQAINEEASNKLSDIMGMSVEKIPMFADFDPLCEGFIVTDITINTYRSITNQNHYFHSIVFSAVNTTRYNTVSFKAELYQDTTPMMSKWNKAIYDVVTSQNVPKGINQNANSIVYVYSLNLLNDTYCVSGQEDECTLKGHNLNGTFSQLLNDNMLQNIVDNKWLQPPALGDFTYNQNGNYDTSGNIIIHDSGPANMNKLVKDLYYIYNKSPFEQDHERKA